ncbi:mitochondrial 54S ribosomal protein YmL16 [Microthyrium microscopicum]|uniref:Mitochondrial 54S ribosomal protein YmL16 n=1 Tax=Microthyrium microscopicum TaxID=703497 RepID=A0A6A6UHU2_9PEZI|nr:mitochondrial 54S ribosomal protein YmL16 [Microthyrium microscopicum]
MAPISHTKALQRALNISPSTLSAPVFLVPSIQRKLAIRSFSATTPCSSKLARKLVPVPPEVSLTMVYPPPKKAVRSMTMPQPDPPTLRVEGPLGKLELTVPTYISIKRVKEGGPIAVSVEDSKIKEQRAMCGTTRAYIVNHIVGVSEGHIAILRLVGVGYRATVETTATTVKPEFEGQKFVNLKVGYSHPIELGIPKGVEASTPQPTRILLQGADKHVVKQFAAHIRAWRVPEPYKGKGIFVNDETITLKAKKIK